MLLTAVLHAQAAGVHGGDGVWAAAAPSLQTRAPPGLHEPPRVWHNTGIKVERHGLGMGWGAQVHGLVRTGGGCRLKATGRKPCHNSI